MFTKVRSRSAQLAKLYGGHWSYKNGTWWCNDNKRHVSKVCFCSEDDDCTCGGHFIMYEEGKNAVHCI